MLKIKILCVGKIKEDYFLEALAEYAKRLSRFCDFCTEELAEARLNGESAVEITRALEEESKTILKKAEGYVVLLDRTGRAVDSPELAKIIKKVSDGVGKITFVIGSSHGVAPTVRQRADEVISFGKITFPHQLFRVVLAEQIYRGFCINNGSSYHK